jgi:hypothetical protein
MTTAKATAIGLLALLGAAGPAAASTIPPLDLPERGAAAAVGFDGQLYGAGDVAFGPVMVGVAGVRQGGDYGASRFWYGAARVIGRLPADPGKPRLGLMLSAGIAPYIELVSTRRGLEYTSKGWLSPELVWAVPFKFYEADLLYRGTFGVVMGSDFSLWRLPSPSAPGATDGWPFVLNQEVAWPFHPHAELVLGGNHGVGLGLRGRL